MSNYKLTDLVELQKQIKNLEDINKTNIIEFFKNIENFIKNTLNLKEEVWVNNKINYGIEKIFGWAKIDSDWHIVIGQREEWKVPDSEETAVYGNFKVNILNCSFYEQFKVFRKIDLLINEIYNNLDQSLKKTKEFQKEFFTQLKQLEKLLRN